jgi:tetratricopeptide (TPR) repeat protein
MSAASVLQQALDFYRETGNRQGEADVLSDFGVCHQGLGDVDTADTEFRDALDIFRALGERLGEAQTLNRQGVLYRKRHALSQAETCHRRALDLARTVDSQLEEARAQEGIGKSASAEADRAAALQEAKVIYQRIGFPHVSHLADDE